MDHKAEIGYALWTVAQYLVMSYVPERRIRLYDRTKFGHVCVTLSDHKI